jgi:hypothetical protein
MFRLILISASILFVLAGCGTKRHYFEPESVAGKVRYEASMPAEIIDVNKHGATLANGQIITQAGLRDIKIPPNTFFLGAYEGRYIAVTECGNLVVMARDGSVYYERKFHQGIASASLQGDSLALVDRTNQLILVDMKSDEIRYQNRQDSVYALDARIAAPYFLNTLVIYPTLDGKVVIVDKQSAKTIRDVVVSSEQFFNNVIFLDVIADRMVVATSKRVISINPNTTVFLDADVKDVIVLQERVYVFTKDGRVILTDTDLNILKERKFPFAVFAGVIHGEYIYMVERGGYLIATDLDLRTVNVFELPDEIDTMVYTTKSQLYVGDRSFRLQSAGQ